MAKAQKILGLFLFFMLIVSIAPVNSEEGAKAKLFLRSGKTVECDKAWIASKDIVRCKKGDGTILYSIEDIDLEKSSGVSVGESLISTPEEETKRKERVTARETARKSGFGARVSYMTFSGDEITLYGVEVDVEPDDALAFGVNYTYLFNSYSSLELSIDYVRTDVQFAALGLSGNIGEITQIPILFTLRLHPATNTTVKPYLGAGIGYYLNSFDTDTYNASLIYGPGAEIDVDDSLGFHVNGGVEFFITEDYSLNLDLQYVFNEIEGEVNKPGFTSEEIEANAVVIGVGIKYFF